MADTVYDLDFVAEALSYLPTTLSGVGREAARAAIARSIPEPREHGTRRLYAR
jgi:hypothetical protein